MGRFFKIANNIGDESKRITEAAILRQYGVRPDSTRYLYKAKTALPLLDKIPTNPFTGNYVVDPEVIYDLGDKIQKGKITDKSDLTDLTAFGYLLSDKLFEKIKADTLKTKSMHQKDKDFSSEKNKKDEKESVLLEKEEEKQGKFFKGAIATHEMGVGSMVEDINPTCPHRGAKGKVVKSYPNKITFIVSNKGPTYSPGDKLTKTIDQMEKTAVVGTSWAKKKIKEKSKWAKDHPWLATGSVGSWIFSPGEEIAHLTGYGDKVKDNSLIEDFMPFTSGFPIGDAIYDFFDGRSDETKNESFHDMMNRTNPTYRQKNEARLVSMADKGMGKPRGLGGYEELL